MGEKKYKNDSIISLYKKVRQRNEFDRATALKELGCKPSYLYTIKNNCLLPLNIYQRALDKGFISEEERNNLVINNVATMLKNLCDKASVPLKDVIRSLI